MNTTTPADIVVDAPAAEAPNSGAGEVKKRASMAQKAKLTFPVARIHRSLKNGRYAARVGAGSAVYLAAVLEYLTAEKLIECSVNFMVEGGKKRITPRHIQLAIHSDQDLCQLLRNVTISSGGVWPHIRSELLPVKKGDKDATGKKRTKKAKKGRKRVSTVPKKTNKSGLSK